MPEIKHTFQGGKMNKDLDERLVRNGEYRHAMNIQVRTTDGDAVGTAQNIEGNNIITDASDSSITSAYDSSFELYNSDETKIIASIADEKNDKAYFFVASPDHELLLEGAPQQAVLAAIDKEYTFIDSIIEVDSGGPSGFTSMTPVVVDKHAIIDTAGAHSDGSPGVLNNDFTFPNSPWVGFDVVDASKYRIGMRVQALDSVGFNLFRNAKIRSISGNTITLYNEQPANIDGVIVFVFTHEDRPLNFSNSNKITGINIVDDLLFWTDNKTEPKRINIAKSKAGTQDYYSHTKLRVTNPNDPGTYVSVINEDIGMGFPDGIIFNGDLKEEHVTVIRRAPQTPPTLEMSKTDRTGNTELEVIQYAFLTPDNIVPGIGDQIIIENNGLSSTDYRPDDILTISEMTSDEEIASLKVKVISYLDITGEQTNNTTDDLLVQVIAINNLVDDSLRDWLIELELKKPLFEKKFGRFGYRYKYDNNEYSSFSPWSELAFLPGEFDYLPRKGYNLGMANEVRELKVKDFIPINTDRQHDVVSVDILFKSTDSPNVYTVKTVVRGIDEEWALFTPSSINDELLTGQVVITSEMIHRALPSNQLLRSWDNVPRYALAQEITANRLLYGNYTQGYPIDFKLSITPLLTLGDAPSLSNPQKSIKSIRNYKIGAVFGDRYGRETPVVESGYVGSDASSTGDIKVPKSLAPYSNKFNIQHDWSEAPPQWAEYIKYYVKETSNEYYNLVMDRWYDAEDGNVWLSFNSADRNKVDEETYLVLKNANGENNAVIEKARYKILAIENEAPDYIKTDHRFMGDIELNPDTTEIFLDATDTSTTQPLLLMEAVNFEVPAADWADLIPAEWQRTGNLRFRFLGKNPNTGKELSTRWVTVNNYSVKVNDDTGALDGDCTIHWSKKFEEEVDFYTRFLNLGYDLGTGQDLKYHIEFKEDVVENKPEFDGRFFVKIERDITIEQQIIQLTPMIEEWGIKSSYTISYISTQPVNPAVNGPYSVNEATGTANQVIAKTQWAGGDQDPLLSTNAAAPDWPGDHFVADFWDDVDDPEVPSIYDFALGCKIASNSGSSLNWSAQAGESTKQYWAAWLDHVEETSATTDEPTGENRIFIDNSRSVFWKWYIGADTITGQMGESNYQNVYLESLGLELINSPIWGPYGYAEYFWGDDLVGPDTLMPNYDVTLDENGDSFNCGYDVSTWLDYGSVPKSHQASMGEFYRPPGFDTSTECASNPECSSTFDTIVFSVIGDTWSPETEAGEFRSEMVSGNHFRFAGDPTNVYRVEEVNYTIGGTDSEVSFAGDYGNIATTPGIGGGILFSSNYLGDANGGLCIDGDEESPSAYTIMTNDTALAGTYGGGSNNMRYHWLSTWDAVGNSGFPADRIMKHSCDAPLASQPNDNFKNKRQSMRVVFRKVDEQGYPTDRGIEYSEWDPRGQMRHDGTTTSVIQFLDKYSSGGSIIENPENSACWETEPKDDINLDLYYEASHAIPMRLREGNTLSFAPINSWVTAANIINGLLSPISLFNIGDDLSTDDVEDDFQIGTGFHHVGNVYYAADTSIVQINCLNLDFSLFASNVTPVLQRNAIGIGTNLTFIHKDGTKTTSKVTDFYNIEPNIQPVERLTRTISYSGANDPNQILINSTADVNTGMIVHLQNTTNPGVWIDVQLGGGLVLLSDTSWMEQGVVYTVELLEGTGYYELDSSVWKYNVTLPWFNCYSFGNGVESDRVRDDFNAPQIDNGVKVSTTFSGYREEKKSSGLIYSGLYNSISEVNDLNEFNMSEKITKDLNPSYGSIQALKTRNTDVVVLTQDKILKVLANKDAVYNADGNPQLIATNRVLGQIVPFAGDYGISNNPESLASDQYRLYFTDKQRGAVLRLSRDGLTPISNVGMKTFFRDNLKQCNTLLGTFDDINGEYNLTLDYTTNIPNTTVSFNEGSKGWVSFKSFVPQAGQSVSDKYITAVTSSMYEHYVDEVEDTNEDSSTFSQMIDNQNTFYGEFTESSIKILFNDHPGSVKSFQAVNYEGSQARVTQFTTADVTDATGAPVTSISLQGDGEYYNLFDKFGWYADSFETDMQSGNIPEFINKENKWFNKVIGLDTNLNNLDTNEFSVQGLGIPTEIIYDGEPEDDPPPPIIEGCMDPVAENYDPTATVQCTGVNAWGCCEYLYGCMDQNALNYDENATMPCNFDATSISLETMYGECCQYEEDQVVIEGCMDNGLLSIINGDPYDSPNPGTSAINYDPTATFDDGSCLYEIEPDPVVEPEVVPMYTNITATPNFVNEGDCTNIVVETQNVQPGTIATLLINVLGDTTVTPPDLSVNGVCLGEDELQFPIGYAEIGYDGTGTWEICTCEDSLTEGTETMTVSITSSDDGTSTIDPSTNDYFTTSVLIFDTSTTPPPNPPDPVDYGDIDLTPDPIEPDLAQGTLTVEDVGDEP